MKTNDLSLHSLFAVIAAATLWTAPAMWRRISATWQKAVERRMSEQLVIRTVEQATRFVENPSPENIRVRPKAAVSLLSQMAGWFSDTHRYSEVDMARWLSIPERTLARRKKSGLLDAAEAERLLRLVRLKTQAGRILGGGDDRATRWLATGNKALGGLSPVEAAATEQGATAVGNLLLQLQDGVFV
jgi:putative toxin-antitoxin system antitoxin component (TIGR02293 family)